VRPFLNRVDAGQQLGRALERFRGRRPLVLGLSRGGVPVAAEVAAALDGDLDVIVAKKLGSPISPELAVGAVTADGTRYLNQTIIDDLQVSDEYLDALTAERRAEAQAQERAYRAGKPPVAVEGRTVILVDDGLATGSTLVAAARSIRARHPERLIIAVPVGPRSSCRAMELEADEVLCLTEPMFFMAVGLHYEDFSPTEDEEVERILRGWSVPVG
jgi:putative phosphoribosyl transferase